MLISCSVKLFSDLKLIIFIYDNVFNIVKKCKRLT